MNLSSEHLAELTSALDAQTGPAHTKAVVGTVDENGAQVLVSFHRESDKGLNWEVQAAAEHKWTGEDAANAKVILKW
jgi:tRNA1(Val) A37 N6-methylase TrmN6